jgi:prepilin-type N-terminal cleavage/methylation domain-containing protein
MVQTTKFKERGVTLVELIVVIVMIGLFASILIANFPRILKQFALSRATYKLAQDFRRMEDLGLSGVLITDQPAEGQPSNEIRADAYGIYLNINPISDTKYILYADRDGGFDFDTNSPQFCWQNINQSADCILEVIDLTDRNNNGNQDLYIKDIENVSVEEGFQKVSSISFAPPNPNVGITGLDLGKKEVGIVLGLRSEPLLTRTVRVSTSGLIKVE